MRTAAEFDQIWINFGGSLNFSKKQLEADTLKEVDETVGRVRTPYKFHLKRADQAYYKMMWRWAWGGRIPKVLDNADRVKSIFKYDVFELGQPISSSFLGAALTHYDPSVVEEAAKSVLLQPTHLAIVFVNPAMDERRLDAVTMRYRKHDRETLLQAQRLVDQKGAGLIPFYSSSEAPVIASPYPRIDATSDSPVSLNPRFSLFEDHP